MIGTRPRRAIPSGIAIGRRLLRKCHATAQTCEQCGGGKPHGKLQPRHELTLLFTGGEGKKKPLQLIALQRIADLVHAILHHVHVIYAVLPILLNLGDLLRYLGNLRVQRIIPSGWQGWTSNGNLPRVRHARFGRRRGIVRQRGVKAGWTGIGRYRCRFKRPVSRPHRPKATAISNVAAATATANVMPNHSR